MRNSKLRLHINNTIFAAVHISIESIKTKPCKFNKIFSLIIFSNEFQELVSNLLIKYGIVISKNERFSFK